METNYSEIETSINILQEEKDKLSKEITCLEKEEKKIQEQL